MFKNKTAAPNFKMTLHTTLRQSCSMYLVNFNADNGLAVVPETSIAEESVFGKECFVEKVATSVLYWAYLVCLHIICNKGDESSLKVLEKLIPFMRVFPGWSVCLDVVDSILMIPKHFQLDYDQETLEVSSTN